MVRILGLIAVIGLLCGGCYSTGSSYGGGSGGASSPQAKSLELQNALLEQQLQQR